MHYISGLEYPAYVESAPLSFITDESGGQIAVVPLDKDVDHTKVYVNPNDDDDDEDEHEEEGAGETDDNETASPLDVEDVEIMEIDDGDDDDDEKSDSNVDKMDDDDGEDDDDDEGNNHVDDGDDDDSDDDYSDDEDDDDDYDEDDEEEDDDTDDSDYEFIPKSDVKSLLEKSTDDDTVLGEGERRGKQTVHRKRKPNIKEIAIIDAENGSGTSIFDNDVFVSVVSFFKCSCDGAVMVTWLLLLSTLHLGVFGFSSGSGSGY